MKERADKLLVRLGFFPSRSAAQAAIMAGGVSSDGAPVTKASQMLVASSVITAEAAHPYVSRGGLKLAHALEVFNVDPAGGCCLDIGASTGGFVDVLLRAGASHITAVDVGREQLHPSLRQHPKVTCLEGTDARNLTLEQLGCVPHLLVCDASFIALEKLLETPLSLVAEGGECVGLFKPQFQVGRQNIGKGGLVKDKGAADESANAFELWLNENGWHVQQWTASPVTGGDGNAERLFHAMRR